MTQLQLFNKKRLYRHHERAMRSFKAHDFLFDVASNEIIEMLDGSSRTFQTCMEIGGRDGRCGKQLLASKKILHLEEIDRIGKAPFLFGDEILPYTEPRFDLILSPLHFHWANDLLGVLIQCRKVLKKDGVLMASLFGGTSLTELRQTMIAVESLGGGAAARIIPMIDVKTLGSLMQRAGFSMVVTDSETIDVEYPSALRIMHDLRGMGETNNVMTSTKPITRAQLALMESYFSEHFANKKGQLIVTCDMLTLTGIV